MNGMIRTNRKDRQKSKKKIQDALAPGTRLQSPRYGCTPLQLTSRLRPRPNTDVRVPKSYQIISGALARAMIGKFGTMQIRASRSPPLPRPLRTSHPTIPTRMDFAFLLPAEAWGPCPRLRPRVVCHRDCRIQSQRGARDQLFSDQCTIFR
jgi:hypothetical protein